ncbi:hypothetical protein MUK42_34133 [Musa troglodytarum]|uniref:Uncharacterized protein n=1 Tax=Musa troglodytarum TaxID=320322 RepID=A0A9E7KFF3_9LILI|nr:hypothetical protein MUK42_34133 [Musa troglodytarum]
MTDLKLPDEVKTNKLVRWAAWFCTHETEKEVTPETDKLVVEFAKILLAKWKAPAANRGIGVVATILGWRKS